MATKKKQNRDDYEKLSDDLGIQVTEFRSLAKAEADKGTEDNDEDFYEELARDMEDFRDRVQNLRTEHKETAQIF